MGATALVRRPERGGDDAFLSVLFATSQDAALATLEPSLRDALLCHQAAGQISTFRTAHPTGRFEVIEEGGIPVGRLFTALSVDALTLVDLVLLPERRCRGVGTHLLRALQAEARTAGRPLNLVVRRDNAAAQRFYARLGFAAAGETDTHLDLQWTP